MNQAQEMFSALIRPFKRTTSTENTQIATNNHNRPGDNVEDGFLLVGQTRSERTTVLTSSFSGNIDAPPSYPELPEQEDGVLPSYTDYCRSISSSSGMDVSYHQTDYDTRVTQESSDPSLHTTAVSDVPFVLEPSIQTMVDMQKGCSNNIPGLYKRFTDLTHYDYDFSVEYTVIEKMTCGL